MLLLSCTECGATYFSAASAGICPDCGADLEPGHPARRSLLADYEDGHGGHRSNVNGTHRTEFDRLWQALLGDELPHEDDESRQEAKPSA
ncbi:MAG: hypothetical protein AUG48_11965 [Actinobacteria bacterium 13_1_20CM_3_68_9]|jgi:rRNA maturation protein Nop10|nr:MAG: hypothetical protein AUG48_11965 [Actinobacteria bacterium 13_1_20CM_3_68_9]